jgi:RHS repeat-associated protein
MKNNAGDWIWPTQDGLGNVRQEVSDGLAVNGVRSHEPFLPPFDEQGSFGMPFAATGEMVDMTGLVYLRNRYLSPALGQFVSLDPLETPNRYAYVSGNPVNLVDPTGLFDWCAGAVQWGDTLWNIAVQGSPEDGDIFATLDRLMTANPTIDNPNNIIVGMILNLPADIKAWGLVNTATSCAAAPSTPPLTYLPYRDDTGIPAQILNSVCDCPPSGPRVISGGFRVGDLNVTLNLGFASIGVDVNVEWRCAPYYGKCGWFATFGVYCGGQFSTRFAQITPQWSLGAGMELGLEYWPTEVGSVSYIDATGASFPYWKLANFQTDVTWDAQNGAFVWQIGGAIKASKLPSIGILGGASVYLGNSLGTFPNLQLPPEAEQGFVKAIKSSIGFCNR